jgi:hypothetical protein
MKRYLLVGIVVGGIISILVTLFIFSARARVRQVANLDRGTEIKFVSICPSMHHGLYVQFEIVGDSQLSSAYVRAFPLLRVDVEK